MKTLESFMKTIENSKELELKPHEKVTIYGGNDIDKKYQEWKDGYYA